MKPFPSVRTALRSLRASATTTALALAIAVFSLFASTRTASAEVVRVGHDFWVGYAAVFIAEAEGFYDDEGLDVRLVSFPGPGDSLPPLIAGQLDLNLTTLHNIALMSAQQDTPIDVLYLLDVSLGADAIVADKSIKTVKDLKGKKIAVTLNEVNHMLLKLALESAGLTEDDVQLVNLDGTAAGSAFIAGRVDAACTWEPWITRAQSTGEGHVVFSTKDVPDTFINVVCATEKTQKQRSEMIMKFVRATDRGAGFLEANPQEGIAIVAAKLEAPAADIKEMLTTDKILDLQDSKELMVGPDSKIAETMGKVIDFLKERDLLNKPLAATDLINDTFVSKAAE